MITDDNINSKNNMPRVFSIAAEFKPNGYNDSTAENCHTTAPTIYGYAPTAYNQERAKVT